MLHYIRKEVIKRDERLKGIVDNLESMKIGLDETIIWCMMVIV